MVVAFHFLHRGQVPGWIEDHAPAPVEAVARYGYLGVHLFFIISGFVIFMSAEGATVRSFTASRVARLYPALWVAAPLTALVAWTTASPFFQVSMHQLLANLTLVPQWFAIEFVDGSYWSLAVELQFYLLMIAIIGLGWMPRIEALLAGWLCLTVVDLIRPIYPLQFWMDVNWAPFFGAGICCFLIRRHGTSTMRWSLLAACYLLALATLLRAATHPDHAVVQWQDVAVPVTVVTVFFALFVAIASDRWRGAASPLAMWAGLLTYPVYLLHQNIGYMLLAAAKRAGMPYGLALGVTVVVIVSAAWGIHRFVESPLGPALRRLLAAPRLTAAA